MMTSIPKGGMENDLNGVNDVESVRGMSLIGEKSIQMDVGDVLRILVRMIARGSYAVCGLFCHRHNSGRPS